MKKAFYFFALFLWVVNTIGGTATHFYNGSGEMGVINLLTMVAVFPQIQFMWKELKGEND